MLVLHNRWEKNNEIRLMENKLDLHNRKIKNSNVYFSLVLEGSCWIICTGNVSGSVSHFISYAEWRISMFTRLIGRNCPEASCDTNNNYK